jgi:pyruvate formate lyase activating enzyme
MVFGGLQKHSLIDYPGKMSCVLFTTGCNFNCPYCHNPELAKGYIQQHLPLEEKNIYDFLALRKGFLDGVVISGGEPTLHKNISSICQNIREMGYAIKLDTNGSRPKILKQLIDERSVDYIAMDIKTDPFAYCPLIAKDCKPESILTSIKIVLESNLPHEFRTTCIDPLVNAGIIERIAKLIQGARLYALQKFQSDRVLHPEFFKENGSCLSTQDLLRFQSIASHWVKSCIVR